jgi:hypothetical protein
MSDATPSATTPGRATATPASPSTSTVGDTLRWLAIAACVGSAVIHFAYAPAHIDESTTHGVFFLAVAWGQLGVAFALARRREVRWPWLAVAALDAAVVGVWVISRTTGVPGSDPESIGFPDALATGLEAVAVVAVALALRPSLAGRPFAAVHPVAGGVAAVALAGLVSASITPSIAGEHHHGRDHEHGEGDMAAVADHADGHAHGQAQAQAVVDRDDRCDLGFNTAAFNEASVPGVPHAHDDGEQVDFTIEEWAEVFVDPADGIPVAGVVSYLEANPVLRDGVLSGGLTHTLDPDPWNPMADPDECAALADELARAKQVAAAYPTVADAEAAGYRKVTTYYPGIAAHYMNFEHLRDGFVLEKPEMLLYDGDGPTGGIVGLSYYIIQEGDDEPAEGFTGDNDHYHRHVGLCIRDGVVAAGSNTTDDECGSLGGAKSDGTAGWMSHVWITPGCESDWGVFSGANPSLTVRGLDTSGAVPTGCGTGKTMADDLAFDDDAGGPSV